MNNEKRKKIVEQSKSKDWYGKFEFILRLPYTKCRTVDKIGSK